MTEISFKNPLLDLKNLDQLDLLFDIYRLRMVRNKLVSKLKSFENSLKSGKFTNSYKLEALKALITENSTQLNNILAKVDDDCNLFSHTKNLRECELYIQNLIKERKKKRIDDETFELTKGHYLQRILNIQDSIRQLKVSASTYSRELREELIMLEDQRIRLTTEKMRKTITKDEFKEKSQEIENLRQKIEDKLAFLKVKLLDYEFEVIE